MLFILAATYRLAGERARQLGLSPNEWQAITSMRDAEKLLGTENPRLERYGLPPDDILSIEGLIRTRMRNVPSQEPSK